jgi:hypothetical protein
MTAKYRECCILAAACNLVRDSRTCALNDRIQEKRMRHYYAVAVVVLLLLGCFPAAAAQEPAQARTADRPVLWSDPGDIRSRNLYWGPGGQEHGPQPPVEFIEEDMAGTSLKFDVRDLAGKKWKAKLGLEAKPETVAARLLWAVGYSANENYLFPRLQVKNLPLQLHRGQHLTDSNGEVHDVRLQRHPTGYKRSGNWNWRNNPFYGTREFNGLRVMMGLIGNWDLKDDNNAILEREKGDGPNVYEVSDVGTAFGTAGKSYSDVRSKGNRAAYEHSRLIAHVHRDYIDLNFPRRPPATEMLEFEWGFYFHQLHIRWIGQHIPRQDAKWIGSLLAQLTPEQIQDAFRAAGYSQTEIDAYAHAVISRIQELNSL